MKNKLNYREKKLAIIELRKKILQKMGYPLICENCGCNLYEYDVFKNNYIMCEVCNKEYYPILPNNPIKYLDIKKEKKVPFEFILNEIELPDVFYQHLNNLESKKDLPDLFYIDNQKEKEDLPDVFYQHLNNLENKIIEYSDNIPFNDAKLEEFNKKNVLDFFKNNYQKLKQKLKPKKIINYLKKVYDKAMYVLYKHPFVSNLLIDLPIMNNDLFLIKLILYPLDMAFSAYLVDKFEQKEIEKNKDFEPGQKYFSNLFLHILGDLFIGFSSGLFH